MENESIRAKIQNLNKELSDNQRSYLLTVILNADKKKSLWNDEYSKSRIWLNSEFLAESKYRYMLHLFFASRDENNEPDARWTARIKFEKEVQTLINL